MFVLTSLQTKQKLTNSARHQWARDEKVQSPDRKFLLFPRQLRPEQKSLKIWPGLYGSTRNYSSTSRECETQPRKSRRITEDVTAAVIRVESLLSAPRRRWKYLKLLESMLHVII